MHRPVFAPSADLPPSDDEAAAQPVVANSGAAKQQLASASEAEGTVGEDSDLDKPIQHDLPSAGRPLKARTSLKQKLGSVLARVGSSRRIPPAVSVSPSKEGIVAQDYISVKRSHTTGGTSPGGLGGRRPNLKRGNSSKQTMHKESSLDEKAENAAAPSERPSLPTATSSGADSLLLPAAPILEFESSKTPLLEHQSLASDNNDTGRDDVLLSADGGMYQGGFVGLARKLSRRATTGGSGSSRYRSRSAGREREREREPVPPVPFMDKAAAEAMLRGKRQSQWQARPIICPHG